jgi:hypothetical protein
VGKRIDDAALMRLLKSTFDSAAKDALDAVMVGNDSQCFTTAQYARKYTEMHNLPLPDDVEERLSRMRLEKLGCREVSPDVWTIGEVRHG